jgi:cysteine-rich repeat protein
LGTDADGSTLFACGVGDNEDRDPVLLRWRLGDSFQTVAASPDPWGIPCVSRSTTLSSNGLNLAVDVGTREGHGWVNVLQNRAPLPGENTTVTQLNDYHNIAHALVPTAISGDGTVVAVYQEGDAAIASNNCRLDPACPFGLRNVLEDLNYDGSAGVGRLLNFPDRSAAVVAPIYWSRTGDLQYVSDAFVERGVLVDPTPQSPFSMSADGRTLFGISTRHYSDGSAHDECFIASFGERPTSPPLPAVPEGCGNGVVDAGEACDDGNQNNLDACTTRCQRVALVTGFSSTCAIHHGRVECWGKNPNIRGPGEVSRGWSKVAIPRTDGVTQLAIGANHACIVREGGTVRCWGNNRFGELGDQSTNTSYTPVDVPGLTGVVQVAAGGAHTCALLSDGTVRCWGNNSVGQLGDETLSDSLLPVDVSNIRNAVQISAGDRSDQTCALLVDGTVSCWGFVGWVATPVASSVSGLSNVRELLPADEPNYALLLDGRLVSWIGLTAGSPGGSAALPVVAQVAGNTWGIICSVSAEGSIACSGNDVSWGVHGTGDRSNSGPVLGIRNAVQIAVSDDSFACALLATGEVRCWGNDSEGQLGNGTVKTNFPYGIPTPVAVQGFP